MNFGEKEETLEQLREKASLNPDDAMAHYYLGKKLFSNPLESIESVEEIKKEFTEAIKLAPNLYMAHFYLGRLYFILKQYNDAEREFRNVLDINKDSLLAKEYLARCLDATGVKAKITRKNARDSFFMLENEIRNFIERKLHENFGQEWWHKGVPKKIRASCAARREEGLSEERELILLYFADFHDYRMIIEENKNIFSKIFDTKLWQNRLSELEPIRNALAHSRLVPDEAENKIKSYYSEFLKFSKSKL